MLVERSIGLGVVLPTNIICTARVVYWLFHSKSVSIQFGARRFLYILVRRLLLSLSLSMWPPTCGLVHCCRITFINTISTKYCAYASWKEFPTEEQLSLWSILLEQLLLCITLLFLQFTSFSVDLLLYHFKSLN